MNGKQRLEMMRDVIQWMIDGEKLQGREKGSKEWKDLKYEMDYEKIFDWWMCGDNVELRLKPEPERETINEKRYLFNS